MVLFCGGLGMRMREHSEALPKPMVQIGYRPILWHVMKYYAHYGHKDSFCAWVTRLTLSKSISLSMTSVCPMTLSSPGEARMWSY